MKIVKTFSKEFIVNNDEAENIKTVLRNGRKEFIELRNGDLINPSMVEMISEPETEAFWDGYPLSKDGKSFMRDGERIYLEPHNFKEIEYRLHPKYGVDGKVERKRIEEPNEQLDSGYRDMRNELVGKMSIGNEIRTSSQEEVARELRSNKKL